jgi:hypothetical protein
MATVTPDPDELLERYETMRGELERLRVKARSTDLSVTVESGPGGGVVSVTLSAEALKQSPQALSASITATIRAAAGKAAEATRQVVAPFVADPELASMSASGRLPPLARPVPGRPADASVRTAADGSQPDRGDQPHGGDRADPDAEWEDDDFDRVFGRG